jgi:nucleoside-diphosphate-sugar epimerase
MKNILITGATGFIGRHLAQRLIKDNAYNIFCLVRNLKKADFLYNWGAKLIPGDITDKASLRVLGDYEIDTTFHCAAYVNDKNLKLLHKVNVLGTENVCDLSLKLGVRQMVYLSSVAVVSGNTSVPLTENLSYCATNRYGESKIEAEKMALDYRRRGLKMIILRPPMVYGEDEPHMLRFLLFLLKHRLLPLVGGRNRLHLAYVENVIAAMIFSLDKEIFYKDSFFVADNESLTVKEIFMIFSKTIGAKPPWIVPDYLKPLILHLPYFGKRISFFLKDRVYNIEKIKAAGFNPPYSAEESLMRSAKELYYGKKR